MLYFGPPRDAPIYDRPERRVVVPVGHECIFCGVKFEADDEGFIMLGGDEAHRACLLRNLLGPGWEALIRE